MSVKIPTSAEVYAVIFAKHKEDLVPMSSFSNPEPSELSYEPQMETSWGLKGTDEPLIKHRSSWVHGKRKETIKHEYWLCGYKNSELL